MDKKPLGNNYNSTENVPDTARRHWRNRSSAAPFSFPILNAVKNLPAWTRWSNWQMPLISLLIFFLGKN